MCNTAQPQYTTLVFENSGEKPYPPWKAAGVIGNILDYESRDLDSATINVTPESNSINSGIHFLISVKLNCWTRS